MSKLNFRYNKLNKVMDREDYIFLGMTIELSIIESLLDIESDVELAQKIMDNTQYIAKCKFDNNKTKNKNIEKVKKRSKWRKEPLLLLENSNGKLVRKTFESDEKEKEYVIEITEAYNERLAKTELNPAANNDYNIKYLKLESRFSKGMSELGYVFIRHHKDAVVEFIDKDKFIKIRAIKLIILSILTLTATMIFKSVELSGLSITTANLASVLIIMCFASISLDMLKLI